MAHLFSVTTYNSQGHGPGRFEYIQRLCDEYNFVFLQEHWLFNSQSIMFENKLKGIKAHAVSGMDDCKLQYGRPYGGCAILWKDSLNLKHTWK